MPASREKGPVGPQHKAGGGGPAEAFASTIIDTYPKAQQLQDNMTDYVGTNM